MGRKAEPVRVITSADLIDNGGQYKLISKYAIKVNGDDNATELIGGAPIVVYPVLASEIGDYNLIQGEPIHVTEAPVSRGQDSSRWAYPVYHVGPGTWPSSPSPPPPPEPSTLEDAAAFWTFYESGGPYADSVGSLDLTAVNTPTQAVGKLSYSANFNSASSETAWTATADAVEADGSFTFAGWVKFTSTIGGRVLAKSNEYQLLISSGRFRFLLVRPDGGASVGITADTFGNLSIGPWYFLAFYYDASVPEIGISVNGGAWDTTAATVTPGATANPMYFASFGGSSLFAPVRLSDWGIWRRPITDDEKTELWNDGLGLTYPFQPTNHPVLPTSFSRIENSALYDGIGLIPFVDGNGDVHLLARRGAGHIDVTGKIRDWKYNGSWSQSDVYDSAFDDRNGGGGVSGAGTLIYHAGRYSAPSMVDILPHRSLDNGGVWETEAAITISGGDTGFSPAGPLVVLPSGQLLQSFDANDGTNFRIFVQYSSDDGETWGSEVTIVDTTALNVEAATAYIDGATDGASRLMCVTRPVLRCFTSADGGATWAELGTLAFLTSVGSDHVTPWLLKHGDWMILAWLSRANPNSPFSYVVGRPNSVFSDKYTWSKRIDIYNSTASAASGDQGNPVVFIYNGQLHVAFYDDDTGSGLPNIMTSL